MVWIHLNISDKTSEFQVFHLLRFSSVCVYSEYFWVFILTVLCSLLNSTWQVDFTESYSSSYCFLRVPSVTVRLFMIPDLRDYTILCLSCAVWPTLAGFISVSE